MPKCECCSSPATATVSWVSEKAGYQEHTVCEGHAKSIWEAVSLNECLLSTFTIKEIEPAPAKGTHNDP